MSAALSLSQGRAEWNDNPRLRLGVIAILAILWLYGILILRDANHRARDDWSLVEERIKRAKSTAAAGEWSARAIDAKSAVREFEQLLWKESSIGLSQAAAQEAAARSLLAAGIVARSVRGVSVEASRTDSAEPVPIRIRAQFEFKPATLYPWLHSITRGVHDKKPVLLVDSLVVRGGPNGYAEVELLGFATKPALGIANGSAPVAASTLTEARK